MQSTLKKALSSVLNQLNESFEVVIVDDGSSDDSVEIIRKLQLKYSNLRLISLPRNKKRTLGETRNISVQNARGEYVILHIDCDDFWHPFIIDFTKIFHKIEAIAGSAFLLSGTQFHIGKKNFLLQNGPYNKIHFGEDREMWFRLAKKNAWIPIDHVAFRERMELKKAQHYRKLFLDTIRWVRDEIRQGSNLSNYVVDLFNRDTPHSLLYRLYKCLIFPIAWVRSRFHDSIETPFDSKEWNRLKNSAWKSSGTVVEFFEKRGLTVDLHDLSPAGKLVFSQSGRTTKLKDLPFD